MVINKCSSLYIGVSWKKTKWEANISVKKKIFYLGRFKHPENAVIVYQSVARQFKPFEFWNDSLPENFQTPISETEGRHKKIENTIARIHNYLYPG